jgi:integrase
MRRGSVPTVAHTLRVHGLAKQPVKRAVARVPIAVSRLSAGRIDRGRLFRRVNKVGRAWGDGMTVKAVWHIVKESAKSIGVAKLAPHDLRRTCARLCHASGGELEQIQFLLGHVSVQTTERYYVRKVDMCRECRKSPVVNGRAWLDSA